MDAPGAEALLITAADRSGETGEVALFAGLWCEHPCSASGADGDVIVQLAAPPGPDDSATVDVRIAVADHGKWVPAGCWSRLDHTWPVVVAPTAAAVFGAIVDTSEFSPPTVVTPPPPPVIGNHSVGRIGLRDLLDARLLDVGDRLAYRRPTLGIYRFGHVIYGGMLQLDDGRCFSTLSAVTTALGSPHQSGWRIWRRARDGRLLDDLRKEL